MSTKRNADVSQNPKKKWLIMVYMQASDNTNLDALAVQDLLEIQKGIKGTPDASIPGNSDVVALVQVKRDWPDLPQLYFIERNKPVENKGAATSTSAVVNKEGAVRTDRVDAAMESLRDFLKKGREVAGGVTNFCLVLWGHNYGLGFGRDHGSELTITQIANAIAGAGADQWLDVLATNSCTMAYIEAAYQFKKSVRFLVASQVYMPLKGFPYTAIVRSIDSSTKPEQLGELFVNEYADSFATSPDGEKVAMSLLNLDEAERFVALLKQTAEAIGRVIKPDGKTIVQKTLREVQDVFIANPAGDVRPVIDLRSLAQDLVFYSDDCLATEIVTEAPAKSASEGSHQEKSDSPLNLLKGSANDLLAAIPLSATPRQDHHAVATEKDTESEPKFVVRQCGNHDLGPLGGVGVFAPFVVDKTTRQQLELARAADRQNYRDFAIFNDDKNWPDLVYDTLRRDEPDEIVNEAGLVQPADREQVNQLVAAVDAAFNILDRVLRSSEPKLLKELAAVRKHYATEAQNRQGATDTRDCKGAKTQHSDYPGETAPFGPPRLRLAGDLSLQPTVDGSRSAARAPEAIVATFERIERAATLVETTIKRVMTNGTFGLGPPAKSVGFGPKPQTLGPKPQTLGPKPQTLGPKPQTLGPKPQTLGPKPQTFGSDDLGSEVGAISAFLSSDAQVAMLSVSVMFNAVATGLANLEQAVSNMESTAATCLLIPDYGANLSSVDYALAIKQLFAKLFSVVAEVALQTRRTAREAMAHPVYGLGNGPQGFGQPQRDELAMIAGLNKTQLALL